MSSSSRQPAVGLATMFPITEWLPHYQLAWLPSDAVAGLTLAAYAIPVSLAYATLAGMPPHYGIYCYLVGGLGYVLFGTSRQLAIGPTSAIAMLVGTTVAGMADGDAGRWIAIASLTALAVAVLSALAWVLRLSGLVSFISETILVGFKAGAALTIGLTQLPKIFGVPGGGNHFFERLWTLVVQLSETNTIVLAFGVTAIGLLFISERFFPGRPIALFVVAVAIAVMSVTHLADRGVTTVGPIPAGLPEFAWPSLRPRDVDGVLPLAAACFLLAYVEGVSAARTLAEKNGYSIHTRQELLGLSAANLAAAFFHGFPVAGGLSQSAVNDKAGAKTPLALAFASLAIGVCLLYFTGLLHNLPSVVLAAIVLAAVRGLVDVEAIKHLWRVSRFEFSVVIVAFAGVLLLGILKGVLLAVIVSILMLLATAARPHVAILGRIPGSNRFSDMARHLDNEALAGILLLRIEASLLYFNVDHVHEQIRKHWESSNTLRLVVCDLSNSPHVDVAGAKMLAKLRQELTDRDILLRIVEAHAKPRDLLRAEGLEAQVGYLGRHISIEQAIAESFGQVDGNKVTKHE